MRRRLIASLAVVFALTGGVALATVADGTFSGTGTKDTKAQFTLTIAGQQVTGFTASQVKLKCNDAAGTTGRVNRSITFDTPAPLESDDSFGFTFSDDPVKPTVKGKVFGIKLDDNLYKGLFIEKDYFSRSGDPKPNGPIVCKSGDVFFKVSRDTPKSSPGGAAGGGRTLRARPAG
jgi:hypothetical protein